MSRTPNESDYKRTILVLMRRLRLKKVDVTFDELNAIDPYTRMTWTVWPRDGGVTIELLPPEVTIDGTATEVREMERLT